MDEAAYVPKGLFFETIVPLLEMQRAALICISTPLDELNWFSALLDVRDELTGDFFFYVVRIGLICKKCLQLPHEVRAAALLPPPDLHPYLAPPTFRHVCTHNRGGGR